MPARDGISPKKIILASTSPRRKALLEQIGLIFEIEPSNYEENADDHSLTSHELARKMSLGKAEAVAARHKNAIVIAADTFGVSDGRILGKPHTTDEARKILAAISGKRHSVITGFSIIDCDTGKTLSRSAETKVYLKCLSQTEIDTYVKSGEPMDKAGAYAIQGRGAVIVEKIEGDYYNVIGLPLNALAEALKEFGVSVLEARSQI